MMRRPRRSPLFPSTTLFRSRLRDGDRALGEAGAAGAVVREPLRSGRLVAGIAPGVVGCAGERCALPEEPVPAGGVANRAVRSEEHTSELQSQSNLVCRLLLE